MDTAQMPVAHKAEGGEKPHTVLFVCTGNTCRSPMAAALYNDRNRPREVCSADPEGCEGGARALSAGLYAGEGDPITPAAVEALKEAGVPPLPGNDYTSHRARRVTRDMMEAADAVVGITAGHAMELTLRFPEFAGKITALPMDIADPYGRGPEAYRTCLMQLRYCLQLLDSEEEA